MVEGKRLTGAKELSEHPRSQDQLSVDRLDRPGLDVSFRFPPSESQLQWLTNPRFIGFPDDVMIEEELAASCEQGCRDFEQQHPKAVARANTPPIINLFVRFGSASDWRSEFDEAFALILPKLFESPSWPVAVVVSEDHGETVATGELSFVDVVGTKRSLAVRDEFRHVEDVSSRVSVSDFFPIRDREPGSHIMNPEPELIEIASELKKIAQLTSATVDKIEIILRNFEAITGSPPASLLTEEERQVFEEISKIPGTDAKARKRVEAEFAKLGERPLSKALVSSVKEVLAERNWGIRCPTCGKPSSPQRRSDDSMQFFHTGPKGQTVTHGSESSLSNLALIDRPKKSRKRRRK